MKPNNWRKNSKKNTPAQKQLSTKNANTPKCSTKHLGGITILLVKSRY